MTGLCGGGPLPELDILGEDGELNEMSWLIMWAVMSHAHELDRANELIHSLLGDAIHQALPEGEPVSLNRQILDWIRNAPHHDEIMSSLVEAANWKGPTAGNILLLVLSLATHAPRLASVNNAVAVVERWNMRKGKPASRKSIVDAWSRFKPVAHLWAAYNLYPSVEDIFVDWAFEAAEAKGIPVSQALESDEGMRALEEAANAIGELFAFTEIDCLPLFLAIAEKLRRDGEQHFAPGQEIRQRPLLDASEMWRAPEGIFMPEPPISYPPLCEEDMGVILGVS